MEFASVKYDADNKEWFGPDLAEMGMDIMMPFGEYLLNKLKQHGDKLIQVNGSTDVTSNLTETLPFKQINHDTGYRMNCTEMRLKSLKVAQQLDKVGIRRGDYVTIIADDSDNLASVYIAALAMGTVVNPLYTGFTVGKKFQCPVKYE